MEIAISPQLLAIERHVVRKGCAGQLEIKSQFYISLWRDDLKSQFYRSFWRSNLISCGRVPRDDLKLQFYPSFWRSNLISCERVARDDLKSKFYLSFWRLNLISCERVVRDDLQIAILLQFLAIEPHFVRKGCVSCRLVGTAPAPRLQERNRKEGEGKRARGQEEKM